MACTFLRMESISWLVGTFSVFLHTGSFFCHMADVTITTGGTINNTNRSIYCGAEKHNSQNSWINVCSPGLNKHLQNSKWCQQLFLNEFHSLSWWDANLTFLFLMHVHAAFCSYNAKHQISFRWRWQITEALALFWWWSDPCWRRAQWKHHKCEDLSQQQMHCQHQCWWSYPKVEISTNPKPWIRTSNAVQIW